MSLWWKKIVFVGKRKKKSRKIKKKVIKLMEVVEGKKREGRVMESACCRVVIRPGST